MTITASTSSSRRLPGGFTLTELLIVMGVIAVLSALTLVSMRSIVRNAKLASSINTVLSTLDNARAVAITGNNLVLLVFRPRIENDAEVVVDLVACRWTGESYASLAGTIDRFEPIPDFEVRTLSAGIKVAAPSYRRGFDFDSIWTTQSHLPRTQAQTNPETPGALIAVMYGPDGTILTSNPRTDASLIWVDFNHDPTDESQSVPLIELDMLYSAAWPITDLGNDVVSRFDDFFRQIIATDEPFVTFAPFISVYDDAAARELKDPSTWSDEEDYVLELAGPDGYITQLGRRIHFNRYSGAAMK